MNLFINTIIITSTIFLVYISFKIYKLKKRKVELDKEELIKKQNDFQITMKEVINEYIEEEVEHEPEIFYELNTHKIKYSLYTSDELSYELRQIYKRVIHNNLWINEPFHGRFYEFLMLINDNQFMIIDPYSKVITMNVRDRYNKVQTSKSYQVYSTKDIIKHMISYCINDITKFNKKDAQNLVISIFIVALKQSVNYLSREASQKIIDIMLKDYKEAQTIRNIIQMIEVKDEQVYFIQESLYDAFSVVETLPYNDSELPKVLEIRKELPEKLLQTI